MDTTAKGLKTNPFAALAGLVVGSTERNLEALGKIITDGINDINVQQNSFQICDINDCISLLKELIEKSKK